jgi:hypothetical protein
MTTGYRAISVGGVVSSIDTFAFDFANSWRFLH